MILFFWYLTLSKFIIFILLDIPEPEEKSMSYIYNPGSNSIRFDVKFEKIFPKPSCKLFTKVCSFV